VWWLTVVLAEKALGGPSALRATPLQRVAGGATKLANLPVRFAANTANRAVTTVQSTGEQASGTLTGVVGAVRETLTVGRAASLRWAERIAEREGNTAAAEAVPTTRRELGGLTAAELPIKGYESLSTAEAAKAVKALEDPEDVRAIIRHEETHKKRSSVISATQTRLADLAKQAVGVSD